MPRPKVVLDVVLVVAYALAASPALTGVPLHELVGIGAFLAMLAHAVASSGRLLAPGKPARAALNLLLVASSALCVVSGVMVSGTVLRALGLYATGYGFWNPLHAAAAKLLLAVVLVHVVMRAPALWRGLGRRPRGHGAPPRPAGGGAEAFAEAAPASRRASSGEASTGRCFEKEESS